MSPSWGLLSLVIFPAGPAGAALKVFCHLLNKQRSWWPLSNSTELSDIYNIVLHNYNYINTLIQWEIRCDASIWVLMVVCSLRWHVPRFSQMDWLSIALIELAHCLIFFIVIISLSDWPSSLVSASQRCYQLTWSVWSVLLLLLVLQISSSHFTEHQSFTESFVLPRGTERRERNVKGIQCVMFALLWTLPVTRTDNVCWTPTPNSRQLMHKISSLSGLTSIQSVITRIGFSLSILCPELL